MNSAEAPKQSSFIVNRINSTPKLCTPTIVDDVAITVGKKKLLSSTDDDSYVELSIAEGKNNKEAVEIAVIKVLCKFIMQDHHFLYQQTTQKMRQMKEVCVSHKVLHSL